MASIAAGHRSATLLQGLETGTTLASPGTYPTRRVAANTASCHERVRRVWLWLGSNRRPLASKPISVRLGRIAPSAGVPETTSGTVDYVFLVSSRLVSSHYAASRPISA
jgi:hypothetical protein